MIVELIAFALAPVNVAPPEKPTVPYRGESRRNAEKPPVTFKPAGNPSPATSSGGSSRTNK